MDAMVSRDAGNLLKLGASEPKKLEDMLGRMLGQTKK
jgi:hypothetical protein